MGSRRSQIKMFETIGVLIVFFVLLAIGIMFYAGQAERGAKIANRESSDLQAIAVAQTISFLPEVQCSFENVPADDCLDIYKLNAFEGMTSDTQIRTYYFSYFGYSTVTVEKLYPPAPMSPPYLVTVYHIDQPPSFKNTRTAHIPVSLYDPGLDRYYVGVLKVEVYS